MVAICLPVLILLILGSNACDQVERKRKVIPEGEKRPFFFFLWKCRIESHTVSLIFLLVLNTYPFLVISSISPWHDAQVFSKPLQSIAC